MRWQGRRQSANVEDRRGSGGPRPSRRRRVGVAGGTAGLVIVIGLIAYGAISGNDVSGVLNALVGQAPASTGGPVGGAPANDEAAAFASVILADTEDTWQALFEARGQTYAAPTLVLFRDRVNSACGMQGAATGPFYCPGDRKAYIDLSFFEELHRRFGAPGDMAQAYVLAHEVGHHIQTLTGVSQRVRAQGRGRSERERNQLSVRQELQADCYAGVWAHHADRQRAILEPGDLEEALRAATAIGDDTLQAGAGRAVRPESFTHGSADQRARWFRRGFDRGDMDSCDTFTAPAL